MDYTQVKKGKISWKMIKVKKSNKQEYSKCQSISKEEGGSGNVRVVRKIFTEKVILRRRLEREGTMVCMCERRVFQAEALR